MGIQNLLPFLANSTREAHISEFENEFVAIDTYCWLHKGIYSCGFDLAMKKPTVKYVTYCMRYIEMLLHFKVKPILVFDGRQLPSKSETEKKRREERRMKFEKGKELLKAGKSDEGKKLLGESVDVTHELALNLIKRCREENIDYIVAPYEADAQLAFLSLRNVVKCVITEDSDLLAYGCEKVMFKMETSGIGKLIEKSDIYSSLGMTPEEFNEDIFRYMCILTGCDYLPSLPSIGPAYALKFVKMLKGNDIYDTLPKLPIYLNKLNIKVTTHYINGFKVADNTFKHQLVYDPFERLQVPLRPVINEDNIVGIKLSEDLAFNLAVGNIDPMTMNKVDDYDPDKLLNTKRLFSLLWWPEPKGKVDALSNLLVDNGFSILWRNDLLFSATPSQSLLRSSHTMTKAKKRQRENFDSDAVQTFTKVFKKQRSPFNSMSIKQFSAKNTTQKFLKSAFIFDSKITNGKKSVSKLADNSKLLKSRYFTSDKHEEKNEKEIEDINEIRRRNESYEDYIQQLYYEYFPIKETEDEKIQEEQKNCSCGKEKENTILESFCSLCKKCSKCCICSVEVSDSQKVDECNRNVEEPKMSRETSEQHFLLDEIYKSETKIKKSIKEDEEDEGLGRMSPTQNLSLNFSKVLSNFNVLETKNFKTEISEEEKTEAVCEDDKEHTRSPSPVFKIQKEARFSTRNFEVGNISDTTATSSSVYFSSSETESLNKSNPQALKKRSLPNSRPKTPSVESSNSTLSKAGKNHFKNSSGNKTLEQYGFKKQ